MPAPRARTAQSIHPGGHTVGGVIAAFVQAAEDGRALDGSGERYTPGDLRELRAALSHVDSELGSMDVRAVRTRHVTALLEELRGQGLSSRRETRIAEALTSLYAYALQHDLVAVGPVIDQPGPEREDPAPSREAPRARPTPTPTPTLAMVAFGARVALWTTWIIVAAFAVLVLALVAELA
jgi:hypothetical protein